MKDNSVLVVLKATGCKTVIDQSEFNPELHEYDYPLAYKGTEPKPVESATPVVAIEATESGKGKSRLG